MRRHVWGETENNHGTKTRFYGCTVPGCRVLKRTGPELVYGVAGSFRAVWRTRTKYKTAGNAEWQKDLLPCVEREVRAPRKPRGT